MRYRKACLVCSLVAALSFGSVVSADEVKAVSEYHATVGMVLDLGDVDKISNEKVVCEDSSGMLMIINEGTCDVTLSDGSLVKLYVDAKEETKKVKESEVESEVSTEAEAESKEAVSTGKESEEASESAGEAETEEATESGKEVSTDAETEKEVESEEETEAETEPETKVESKSETEVETEPKTSAETESETEAETESETEESLKPETEGISEAVTDSEEELESETETEVKESEEETSSGSKEGSTEKATEVPVEVETIPDVEVSEEEFENEEVVEVEDNSYLLKDDLVGFVGESQSLKVMNGSIIDVDVEDSSVVTASGNRRLSYIGGGKSKVYINTGGKVLQADVTVLDIDIDTSKVTLGPWDGYQIEINGDTQGFDPKYDLLSGEDEGCTIDSEGYVQMVPGVEAEVKITIAGKEYRKPIEAQTKHEYYWNAMQPYIEQCLGTPYVFGGATPGAGMDCSGYVSYVLSSVGLMSGRTSAQGIYNMCVPVENPEPGDLVFFTGTYDCPDYITHIGIYAGDGCMYHSGKPNQYTAIDGYYAQHLAGYGSIM